MLANQSDFMAYAGALKSNYRYGGDHRKRDSAQCGSDFLYRYGGNHRQQHRP